MKKLKSLKLMLLAVVALCSSNAFGADVNIVLDKALQGGATSTTLEYTPSPYELTYTIKNLVFNGSIAADKVKKAEVIVTPGSAFTASTASVAPDNTVEWEVNFTKDATDYKIVVTFKVTDIAANAFKGKTAVTTVTLPANVVNIGASAFEGTKATSVTISANANIGASAFKNTELSSLTIGDKATIGPSAFEGTDLTSVALGKFVSIGDNAFKDCADLATVTFTQPGAASASVPQQTIGAGAFSGTVISDLNLSNTNLLTVNRLFEEYNSDLTKVTFPATLTSIAASAFEKCVKLATLDFDLATKLTTIGSYAFGTTPKLTTVNLEKCEKLIYFTADGLVKDAQEYTTPFISAGGTNSALTTVTLPKKNTNFITKDLGVAFAKCSKLATLNNIGAITLVTADAFNGDAALTEISLPNTVTDIAADALRGAGFTKVTIASSATDGKPTIAATSNEDALKTVWFTGEFKGALDASAFTGLTDVKFADFNGTITEAGIVLAADADATVTMGAVMKDFTANAITGPTSVGKKADLNLGAIGTVALTKTLIKNNVGTVTFNGAISKSLTLDVVGTASKIDFKGNLNDAGAAIVAFSNPNTTLKTIEFNSVKLKGSTTTGDYTGCLITNQFQNATGITTVNWNPATADALMPFANTAFKAAAKGGDYAALPITFTTITNVAVIYGAAFATTEILYNAKISADAVVVDPETKTIDVAAPAGFKFFYGKMYEASAYTVPAKDGDVENMVYSAYKDKDAENASTIYMDPLRVIDGKYYIPANTPVIVKSTSSAAVTITKESGKNSMHYAQGGALVNDIKYMATKKVGQEYFDVNPGKTIYAMAKTSTNGLKWKTFGADVVMPAGTFYVMTDTPVGVAAAPELNIVWLDGSEENNTTGVTEMKTVERNDGVIYNLAGQKVGADYKGVVIKNGKKFFQK